MEFKGTPGPWRAIANSAFIEVGREINYNPEQNNDRIFTCHVMLNTYDTVESMHFSDENYANAKLIAAAPHLLEAALYWMENHEKDDPMGTKSEAIYHTFAKAIEKALK